MKKIISDFRRGIERIRWFSSVFSERLKIETAIIKLLYESDKVARSRNELLARIGERVIELKGHHDKNILKDSIVASAVSEIEKLDSRVDELKIRVSELGKAADQ